VCHAEITGSPGAVSWLSRPRRADADPYLAALPTASLDPRATASLDPRGEHDLFRRIRQLYSGRTVMLVSHRYNTVRHADHIYVLAHGRIIEHGSHDDLMAAAGVSAELFTLQAAAYTDRPSPNGHRDGMPGAAGAPVARHEEANR
jgi:ABC-type cobalamin/Fe3+-siderophores transport system ATPase subunit